MAHPLMPSAASSTILTLTQRWWCGRHVPHTTLLCCVRRYATCAQALDGQGLTIICGVQVQFLDRNFLLLSVGPSNATQARSNNVGFMLWLVTLCYYSCCVHISLLV